MPWSLANVGGRAALVAGGGYHDLEQLTGGELGPDANRALAEPAALARWGGRLDGLTPTGRVADVVLGPPVPAPRSVFAIGLNYPQHAAEGAMAVPDVPLVFAKFASCLARPDSDVELRSDTVDYEGELVVVIGRGGRDLSVEDAWDHVAGLTVGQDVSDRLVQFAAQPPHFDLAKSFDTYGPIGPVVVSTDSVPDRDDLRLRTLVNGEVRQDASTTELVFDVAHLVSYLSRVATLHPGDLVFTGTPDGIGAASGRFLADGDVVKTSIEGIGTLTNRCVRSTDHGLEAYRR